MQYTQPNLLTALEEGTFSFAYGISPWLFGLLVLLIIAGVWFTYFNTTRPLTPAWKTFFVATRSSVLVFILFCLLRPVITTMQAAPQETYLGVLIDDSQSMAIADLGGDQSRQAAVAESFFADGVIDDLAESFQIRTFRFDSNTQRINGVDGLNEEGTASSINQALQYVDDQLNGLRLGGLVLVSDGADNGDEDPINTAQDFGNRQIPIFTVGVGQEDIPQDIGIVDVTAAKTVLEGSVFNVQVGVSHQGFEGQEVELSIRDGEEVVASEVVTLGAEGVPRRFDLELTPERTELIVYDLQVELQSGEIIEQNNAYSFLVDNTEKPALDVLYIEGHPRNEYKFIRRAVQGDASIRLATYLQTGPEKYYRQGIESPTELSAGFPRTKEDLYAYEAIILGDIEESFFNSDQLQMIDDFVAERGGGFLMSGMVDEEFIGSPIADILPITLVEENFLPPFLRGGIRRGEHATGELYYPRLTNNGEFSPLLRLSGEDGINENLWRQLPELQGVYVSGRIKPGATVLLEHPVLQYQNQLLPIIAQQRYGSGRAMSVTTASTWRWQMMMHSEDQSHETLWRQLLRWLAVSAPERITIEFDREFYNVGDEVNVTAVVLDDQYEPDNDATLWMQTTDPLDQVIDVPMEWDIEEDGVYRANFTVEQEGVFSLLVDVASAAGDAASGASEKRTAFVVTPSLREYTNAEMDAGLLGRIADASGGSYFNLSDVNALPESVEFTPNAYSREVQIDLWDQPWLLALLILLLCVDWIARRLKGLS
ncbi:MAG: VWA domain-containing protein [Gammaproteobacteria bacterium]|nr:VWA domain-containing protein [Gammaproteobacteria bacterium]MDD9958406.1 VWA domain-containing protein [Gammaproteobacteria bacterium]